MSCYASFLVTQEMTQVDESRPEFEIASCLASLTTNHSHVWLSLCCNGNNVIGIAEIQ